jgi:hypothetical protein
MKALGGQLNSVDISFLRTTVRAMSMRDTALRTEREQSLGECLVAAGRLRRTRHRFGVSQLAWISPCRRQGPDLWGSDISPKALGPTDGLSAVLGRNALKEPGDCDAARHTINDTKPHESQDAHGLAQ